MALVPFLGFQGASGDIPQQILEIINVHISPASAMKYGIANSIIIMSSTSYLRDHSYSGFLFGMPVRDCVEELRVVEMAVAFIFQVPLAAGAVLGYTGALVVARGKEIGYAGCYGVHCEGRIS